MNQPADQRSIRITTDRQDTHFVFDGKQIHVLWFFGEGRPIGERSHTAILKHKRPGQKRTFPPERILRICEVSSGGLRVSLRTLSGEGPPISIPGLDSAGANSALKWFLGSFPGVFEETTLKSPPWEAAKKPLIGLVGTWVVTGLLVYAAGSEHESVRLKTQIVNEILQGLGGPFFLILGAGATIVWCVLLTRALGGHAKVRALVAR